MKSHEVLRTSIHEAGVKSVASDLGLSQSLIYKWCAPQEGDGESGADNPLDRLMKIYECTGDLRPIEWLCERTGGFRVDNPKTIEPRKEPVLQSTQTIVKEFSDMLEAVSESYSNGNRIDTKEASRIRKEWEELKVVAESFVNAAEAGIYDHDGA